MEKVSMSPVAMTGSFMGLPEGKRCLPAAFLGCWHFWQLSARPMYLQMHIHRELHAPGSRCC